VDTSGFSREFGYLKFSHYNNYTKYSKSVENRLSKIWYQPEEIFPVDGTPEVSQHAFWVPVDKTYFEIARKLKVKFNYTSPFHYKYMFSSTCKN
jgi:hypothetical protein